MSDTESENMHFPAPPPPPPPPPLPPTALPNVLKDRGNKKVSFNSLPRQTSSPVPSVGSEDGEVEGITRRYRAPTPPPGVHQSFYDNAVVPSARNTLLADLSAALEKRARPNPRDGDDNDDEAYHSTHTPQAPTPPSSRKKEMESLNENSVVSSENFHVPAPPPQPIPTPPLENEADTGTLSSPSPVPSAGSRRSQHQYEEVDDVMKPGYTSTPPPSRRRNGQEQYDNFQLPAAGFRPPPNHDPSPPPSEDDYEPEIVPDDEEKPETNGGAVNGGFLRTSGDSETGEKRYSLRIPVEDTHVHVDVGEDVKKPTKAQRETLFFPNCPDKRIDYVLVYEDHSDEDRIIKRTRFEDNLKEEGLELEHRDKTDSVDGKSNFTLIHATWDALTTGAELMNMQKRIKMPKNLQDELHECCDCCCNPFEVGEPVVTEEDDYFTSGFSRSMIDTFDIDMNHKEDFFSNAERSLIVKEILDRTAYTDPKEAHPKIGIQRLIRSGCYSAAFPLHEGPHRPRETSADSDPWEGADKDRARLYEAWARPGRFYCYQPLDLIRNYFGEKIGIYFAWLGFYTGMLIPASIVGLAAFIYGCVTLSSYVPVNDVCKTYISNTTMCPECDKRCSYWFLGESCVYARITYLFDNWATVAFAGFMSLWATVFLEFWKRKQKELEYDWDVANFELEERLRPDYEMKVRHHRQNPITLTEEPFMPWYEKLPRQCVSLTCVIFFICLVVAAIFGVIIYRIVIVVLMYSIEPNETIAKLATSITASLLNLIIIMILNVLYKKVAWWLTGLERPRTDTEFEDSFTFKMFLFQFVNFYGSIFYIAFLKGRFSEIPGLKRNYLFGYRQDTCDPSGCLVDLFIQLAIVMVGKQFINNSKEILLPVLVAFCRVKDNKKKETKTNLYMRWEQDNDLPTAGDLGLFEEYLEMVIQYGFVTIFVAAFPLAPLFALLNNVIEIRLDAYKFVKAWRRAPAAKAQDIGVWFGILQSITFIAILSNAFIIGWTSDFIPKMYYYFVVSNDQSLTGYIEHSLAYFDTNDFLNDTRPDNPKPDIYGVVSRCRFKGYVEDPSSPRKYEYTREYWHIFSTRLAFVIVFEHTIFLLSFLVSQIIPDMPSRVKRLMLYENALTKKMKFDAAYSPIKKHNEDAVETKGVVPDWAY